jgi:hypothetical protein
MFGGGSGVSRFGGLAMSAYGMADSAELANLTQVLKDHCAKYQIVRTDDREQVAVKILCLFRRGLADPDRLSAELEKAG